MQIRRLFVIAFSLYLGLSPIYWFPYVPPITFGLIKYLLFGFICTYALIFNFQVGSKSKFNVPGGNIFLFLTLGMLAIVFLTFVLGDNQSNLNMVINFFQILLFVIATGALISMNQVLNVIRLSLNILSCFVVLSVIFMFVIPFTLNPFNSELFLIDTGFGGLRTGWSPAIGLFVPFIFYIYGSIILLSIYLLSQVLTGGRAGFYVSVISLLPLFYTQRGWQFKTRFLTILFFSILTLLVYNPSFLSGLRVFDTLSESKDLDTLSTGRVSLFMDAWQSILNNPILGNAVNSTFLGEEVHNVFIKGWVYYGIFYFIFSILLVIYILILCFYKIKYSKGKVNRQFFIAATLVIFYGILIGMVEPQIIYGNFTNFSIWWFVFALIASKSFKSIDSK